MDILVKRASEITEKPHPKFENVFIRQLAINAETDRFSASLVRIVPGAELLPHTHDVLEMFYILCGQGEALVGEEKISASEGTLIIAPAGKLHGMKNLGDTDIQLYAVFSPAIA